MTNPTNYFLGLIIDNARALQHFGFEVAIRTGLGSDGLGSIPEDLSDLFYAAPFVMLDTKETRVIIDFI